jgi:hypothetical protein
MNITEIENAVREMAALQPTRCVGLTVNASRYSGSSVEIKVQVYVADKLAFEPVKGLTEAVELVRSLPTDEALRSERIANLKAELAALEGAA